MTSLNIEATVISHARFLSIYLRKQYLSYIGVHKAINQYYYTILVGPVVQMNMSFHIMLLQYPGEYIFMILVISDRRGCGKALTQILAKTLKLRNLDHS